MTGSAPRPRPPSAEERALYKQQAISLERQTEILGEFADRYGDISEEQLGLARKQLEFDHNIRTRQFELTEQAYQDYQDAQPSQDLRDLYSELAEAQGERALAAARGELPVDAGIRYGFERAEEQLEDRYRNQLGQGFETSTPYQQALSDLTARREIAFDAASRGDLSIASQLFGGSVGGITSTAGAGLGASLNTSSALGGIRGYQGGISALGQSIGGYGALAGGYGQLAQGYGAAAGQQASNRFNEYQGRLSAYNAQQGLFGQLGQAFGGLAGTGLGLIFG